MYWSLCSVGQPAADIVYIMHNLYITLVNIIATMNMFSKCTPVVRWVQCCMWLLGCVCALGSTCLCVAMLVDVWTLQPLIIRSASYIGTVDSRLGECSQCVGCENRLMLVWDCSCPPPLLDLSNEFLAFVLALSPGPICANYHRQPGDNAELSGSLVTMGNCVCVAALGILTAFL